ncbi:SGNH/GDSL hydrolase family protein [Sphingobium sp. HBC34]|uniref:SGNH/GDSL hydrolase family protein n=1 Tax=Sphingobium cyanobacteriorum TaxID=3063954 RepID=A0ABT8ZMJ3_9SPHN|nr:SGNH/GDSL hydrolase family protein [Sphingobium sp. HBC34]MDO7835623.1 SGNH/GDSL hydrolase family protein [Sphingobium sp. HBC34]
MRRMRLGRCALAVVALHAAMLPIQAFAADKGRWIASWASSPSRPIEKLPYDFWQPAPQVQGTIRYHMRLSAGGTQVQVRLSGETQVQDVTIGGATIALADAQGGVDAATIRPLTFSGARSARLPTGAPLLSDPLALAVKPGAVAIVSVYLPAKVILPQSDPNHVAQWAPGADQTASPTLTDATSVSAREIISSVLVLSDRKARTIVTFGDSITDGFGAKDPLLRGWPGQLARMLTDRGIANIGIANAGIGGNRVLRDEVGPSALARFDRDALAVPGVTDIVLLEGINDLGLSGLKNPRGEGDHPVIGADDLIAGYRQLIQRARSRAIKVHGATLTPFLGSTFPGYATVEKEKIRQAVNQWIRTSGAFDGVIDFDATVRDPAAPDHILAAYDCGDKLHPSDAGYAAMAKAARDHFRF